MLAINNVFKKSKASFKIRFNLIRYPLWHKLSTLLKFETNIKILYISLKTILFTILKTVAWIIKKFKMFEELH